MPSAPSIAIVGLACVYPDARTPAELWENVLAQRRAFRRLPEERLSAADYWSADPSAPDRSYAFEAALIEGYEFDRVAFRVVGSTFRSADLAHWLALDVAARALADAGFPEGRGLPRESTGVLLGNTLTGEFSRSNVLRLRWPFVRRLLEPALAKQGWASETRRAFLAQLEQDYKRPFPPVGEETLAGGLSNTIAGRICNQFDFKGGGYTVDGACASSLLAIANACTALTAMDLDVALAGGVDLSLDPFELVGFAKTGALAAEEMRVFDRRSAGFWPGEGCGMVALMRQEDALAQGCRIYAVIRGWGVSSDGSGGITRPEAYGQLEALRRAYRRAGFGIDTVAFCEGHGTGTAVGDATELEVLSRARREAKPDAPSAVIGSIKANIGHTKAAAGVAGLIKATMAVHTQVLPPTTACQQPHAQLSGPSAALRVLPEAEVWPANQPLRASVSAMGFGGINAHVVLESNNAQRRASLGSRERWLSRSHQDAELFVLSGSTVEELQKQANQLASLAARISRSELGDLAARLHQGFATQQFRAAILAAKPCELAARLEILQSWLQNGIHSRIGLAEGVFLGSGNQRPQIGFLFPGQGSPTHLDGGLWRRRFESVRELYARVALPADASSISTRVMQPAVATASLAGLKVLNQLGIFASAAIGHSLGEFSALHWAGVLDEDTLLRIVRARGNLMADLGTPTGAMAAVAASWQNVQPMLAGTSLVIVGFNSPRQTVVAGDATEIKHMITRARAAACHAVILPVSHAFHTPLVSAAVPALAEQLEHETFGTLNRSVFSTVTGSKLTASDGLRALLCRQVTSPVRFSDALAAMLEHQNVAVGNNGHAHPSFDLLIEVGPGTVLRDLALDMTNCPVVALDAGGASLQGLLQTAGVALALGAPVRLAALFADRFTRPFALDWKPKFFLNPCELAPVSTEPNVASNGSICEQGNILPWTSNGETVQSMQPPISALELVRQLVANRTELPLKEVQDDHRMLSDLHLNSISVGQLVSEAARRLGLPRLVGLTDFANASVQEMARALDDLKRTGASARIDDQKRPPAGVDAWTQTFSVELVEANRKHRNGSNGNTMVRAHGAWHVFAPEHHLLGEQLRKKLTETAGHGVVVWLPEQPTEAHLRLLLEGARATIGTKGERRFVLVQHGWGGAGFARTFHQETSAVTCVINVPTGVAEAVDWIVLEAAAASGYTEAHYDSRGQRFEPRLKWRPITSRNREAVTFPIGSNDVLLVTGGGKGIAAECALALAREAGVSLALMGRADPATDQELAQNLSRLAATGVSCCYVRADVTDAAAVRVAVAEAERKLGPITALLHGAGINKPQLIASLDEVAFRRTLAPKIQGAQNVLDALDADRLRVFITFGSIIARAGLRGEADYATANEWMTALTEQFQRSHPKCRCLALEWSVWSDIGMGERLGRVEALIQEGITPITPDEGVRILLELLLHPPLTVAVVICGRFGEPPTVKLSDTELPLRRFLERKRVHYPGIELVVDVELSVSADPYLNDHVVQRQRLFPAVLGLEAMAQAAMALTGLESIPVFEQVELSRPVSVSETRPTTIRLAALRRGPDLVEVCLRSEETDYHVDHFRAICRFAPATADISAGALNLAGKDAGAPMLSLEPREHLYGRILFHEGRFRRLRSYDLLKAKECSAEILPDADNAWFGPYLPADFVLGDPAGRDAALHAIQACIPHRRILPFGIDRMVIHRTEAGARVVRAKERSRDGNNFIYDLEIIRPGGEVLERWEGLRLRAVELLPNPESWPASLLAPYLERRFEELMIDGDLKVAFSRNGLQSNGNGHHSKQTDQLLHQALGAQDRIWRRPDGKPVTLTEPEVSAAHAGGCTLATAGGPGTACDLEQIQPRPYSAWFDLLGEERFKLAVRVSRERNEGLDTAATRIWAALECMKKAGVSVEGPLTLHHFTEDGWMVLRAGALAIAACVTTLQESPGSLVVALALKSVPAAEEQRATRYNHSAQGCEDRATLG